MWVGKLGEEGFDGLGLRGRVVVGWRRGYPTPQGSGPSGGPARVENIPWVAKGWPCVQT